MPRAKQPRGEICGAHSRRTGQPCKQRPLKNSNRCRMHGGRSCGARTPEGKQRIMKATTKHGRYSKRTQELLGRAKALGDMVKGMTNEKGENRPQSNRA